MILMQLNNLSKSFGAEEILSNIKLEIKENDRIAIVGRNGAGKSTLLKIMAEEMPYDEGEIFKPKGLSIGYLTQHSSLESDKSIWDEMMEVFDYLLDQQQELRTLEEKMKQTASLSRQEYDQLLLDYDRKQQAFDEAGGYRYEADIKAVLTGLNFQDYDYNTPINELSGGQKTRLSLGKLLLKKPELLILDEPTNHLDIDTMAWLENYLTSYPGAVLIVSHDRYFLDKTVSIVYEISRNNSKKYNGNYSYYLKQRALDYEQELKEYEKQQTEIKRMEDFIQRNIARASTSKRAQSRRKQLAKMKKLDAPKGDEKSANFSFKINRASGNDVLKIDELAFQYETDEPVFSNLTLHMNRGERFALVGPNGVGKSTLLKTILGEFKPNTGTIKIGTNVQIGYYDQEQEMLASAKTVLDELWDLYPDTDEKDIRTVLGNFLFSGEDVLKTVHSLSGGEKARLSLSKLMMEKANLLVLDEPTNHLDIDSKEVLEAALMDFPGTIIFVSHDRYFINRIADKVVEMRQDGSTVYLGDYDYYTEKKQEEIEIKKLQQSKETVSTADQQKSKFHEDKQLQRQQRKKERRINELEETIEQKEAELAGLEQKMTEPEVYEDHEKSLELTKQTSELKQEIDQLMEEWTTLQE
ncbi:ABC-F family ATP-binding cassette domain-containing protein [Lentibacillus amyloliquefaciens]|uniref:Multidrug ABC transporter ATP-binding protein n=1 Tax=Lentibacillus amyloliquefaciens TaxID=1472767 RepID=A0A0U3NVM5_9BACI|nr:ABC-F family ATP-binding cassette domain-containing protein [Lentibacillus amyloliquefaciens]ALX50619.1 multidrug ABC transporter ATP-binding protein [Lentibacillus amyloliquefaciens]